jgi:hypothetical protein
LKWDQKVLSERLLKIFSERFLLKYSILKYSSWVLQVFSDRFLLIDSILKDSFLKDAILKDAILKDFGFVEKRDSERFHSERFRALFETTAILQFKSYSFWKCSPNCFHLKL